MQNVLKELCSNGIIVKVENLMQEMEIRRICKDLGYTLDKELEMSEEMNKDIPFPVFYGFDHILGMPYIGCSDFIGDFKSSKYLLDYYQFRKTYGE